jgi:hypothetical protein
MGWFRGYIREHVAKIGQKFDVPEQAGIWFNTTVLHPFKWDINQSQIIDELTAHDFVIYTSLTTNVGRKKTFGGYIHHAS